MCEGRVCEAYGPPRFLALVMSSLSYRRCLVVRSARGDAAGARGQQPFLAVVIHAVDEALEADLHVLALDLARCRYRLALLLRIELLRQDAERLHLLDAREAGVGLLHLRRDQRDDARALREAGEAGIGDVVG